MQIHLRYFAALREALGPAESVTTRASTVGALRDELIARGGAHADALGRGRPLRAALGQVMCDESTPLQEGAEVAFFPPVTGG